MTNECLSRYSNIAGIYKHIGKTKTSTNVYLKFLFHIYII